MPESSYWQLCPPSKSGLQQGGLLSSSFPPGPLVPPDGPPDPLDRPCPSEPLPGGPCNPVPLPDGLRDPAAAASASSSPPVPPPPPPPPPKRHCRSLSVPEDLSRCRYTWRPSASRVWTPVSRQQQQLQQCHMGGAGGAACMGGGGACIGVGGACMSVSGSGACCPLRAPSSSLNSSLHSSSSPTFFSLALSPDSPLPWSFPWDPSEAASGGCCCFFPSPSSCSSSPPPPQRRFSLSPVLIRDSAACHSSASSYTAFVAPRPVASPSPSPAMAASRPTHSCCYSGTMGAVRGSSGGSGPAAVGNKPESPSSACSTPCSLRRSLPPQLPRCHSQPCDLLLLKPGLKRRRDHDRPCARPVLDFTKMTQTRSMDPQFLERHAGRFAACGGEVFLGMDSSSYLADYRGSCSPAECLGRSSIGPLSESDEDCCEEEGDERGEREEAGEREREGAPVFERDCTELDLNLIEEN